MRDILGKNLTRKFFHRPILVVGASRSGTSILLQALGRHPLILTMAGESPFLTSIGGATYLFEFSDNRDYYLASLHAPKDYLYDSLRRLGFETVAGPYYGLKRMLKGLMQSHTMPFGKRFWCVKTFPSKEVARALRVLYPGLRVINIVRNGCDVVQSRTKFSGFNQQSFREHCREWAQAIQKFSYLTDAEMAVTVQHESLVKDPEAFFHGLFDFLGIEQHGGPAAYAMNTLVHPLDQETRDRVNVREILGARHPGYEDWSEEQKATFRSLCGVAMAAAGYEMPF
jgi:hypothetical protein